MEFLARSWSPSAFQLSISDSDASPLPRLIIYPSTQSNNQSTDTSFSSCITDEITAGAGKEESVVLPGNTFSFASSASSQLVLQRIMSQTVISPITSGRLSHSSGPSNASLVEASDSHPLSPTQEYDQDIVKYLGINKTVNPLSAKSPNCGGSNTSGGRTVGRWLKDRKEKKREDNRAQNAQIHAAVTVAGVAAALAAIAAATATTSASTKDEQMAKTDMAVASAATLVAARCVEAAESLGAEQHHLLSVVNSAVNVRSHGDILTLTAAAATALRGAATLKARALKEAWNIAAVIPIGKGYGVGFGQNELSARCSEEQFTEENSPDACIQKLLAKGSELLKRTRNGDLHWKFVSVYIHRSGQVMLKMKSKHAGSTITKKKKNVVLEVRMNTTAWPGRQLSENGEQHRYFGLRTTTRGIVEFECKNDREYEMWTRGVSRLLSVASQMKNGQKNQPRDNNFQVQMSKG
ncbi:VAN3-binding protein-like [Apium graveolens]|uniref:VAN3-binding protein-like n=1 Tax=Apium graveolens TaxID=4045 RepID=UPI003D7B309A